MARDRRDDYDDDDRPRRRRDDDYRDEDRPQSRRRRDYDDGPPPRQASVLGILALVGGIPSAIVSFIPCCGWVFGLIGGGISLLLGIIGWVTAKGSNGRVGTGLPIAGTILGGAAIIISVVWLIFFGVLAATAPTTPGVTGTSISTTDPVAASVTADQLASEYDDDEEAADIKYLGKVVEVTGRVKSVRTVGKITVELDAAIAVDVDCHFNDDQRAVVENLTTGSAVTIRGRCEGSVLFDVVLNDCIVIPGGPGKPTTVGSGGGAIKVTAERLRKEADEDLEAATRKYDGKRVEVSGQVTGIDRTDPAKLVVGLGVGDRGDIQCWFALSDVGMVDELMEGQQVILRGTCIIDRFSISIATVKNCTLVK